MLPLSGTTYNTNFLKVIDHAFQLSKWLLQPFAKVTYLFLTISQNFISYGMNWITSDPTPYAHANPNALAFFLLLFLSVSLKTSLCNFYVASMTIFTTSRLTCYCLNLYLLSLRFSPLSSNKNANLLLDLSLRLFDTHINLPLHHPMHHLTLEPVLFLLHLPILAITANVLAIMNLLASAKMVFPTKMANPLKHKSSGKYAPTAIDRAIPLIYVLKNMAILSDINFTLGNLLKLITSAPKKQLLFPQILLTMVISDLLLNSFNFFKIFSKISYSYAHCTSKPSWIYLFHSFNGW